MIFSPFVKQPSGVGSLSTHVTGKSPHMQKECQLPGPAAPLSMERSPLILHQLILTFSHLCVRMTCLTTSLLTARTG